MVCSFLFGILLIFDISWSTNSVVVSDNTVSLNTLKGYVDRVMVLYVVTYTSNKKTANCITNSQSRTINFAPVLASVPNQYLQQGYPFLNGIRGKGPFSFQLTVGPALPGIAIIAFNSSELC